MRTIPTDASVLTALSGGVDSAIAAALLVEQGHTVIGAMLQLWGEKAAPAINRARRVTEHLGIPFRLIEAQEVFRARVMDYFIAEYAAGRTPNPCVLCNRFVRFDLLTDQRAALDMDLLATGHYARVRQVRDRYHLLRGRNRHKDQSYFLHQLTQEQLAQVVFPLGERTKEEVRRLARERDLPVADQAESQDVCFAIGDDYRRFIAQEAPELMQPGPIRDPSGRVLGQHQGLPGYTIGQRKGLGISASEPLYVLAIEPENNALIVGPADELGQDKCIIEDLHIISAEMPAEPFRATAKIRYRARPAAATVTPLPSQRAHIHFDETQRDITPGQFLVLYQGEIVLGGGTICKVQKSML
jgi:tRNA-specific 2-thiouridylase